jgi:hypothetical protein
MNACFHFVKKSASALQQNTGAGTHTMAEGTVANAPYL